GWSGVAGSLTAKLAVTAIVVVGVGYAALGSHAHASQSGRPSHAALTPAPIAVSAPSQALFVLPDTPFLARPPYAGKPESAHGARSKQRPTAAARLHSHAALVRDAASRVEAAAAREFGPERASGPAPTQPTAQRAGSPVGEFGFE
ncbi:MAG: hypothetical protein WAU77_09955, partial [Solirubrobacteraceae bacterium]